MEYQNTNSSRGFASNNPFRRDIHNNHGNNNFTNNYTSNSPIPLDKRSSTNPFLDDVELELSQSPSQPFFQSNTIPQYNSDNHSNSNLNNSGTVYRQNKTNNQYSSAEEEKERLRQRYMEKDMQPMSNNNSSSNNGGVDLPPSYDEITDRDKTQYPNEKNSNSRGHDSNTRIRSNSGQRLSHHNGSSHHPHHNSNNNNVSSSNNRSHRNSQEKSHRYHSNSTSSNNGGSSNNHSSSKHSHSRDKKDKKDKKKKNIAIVSKNVDTIDKLDVTGLFGGSFHHDGPFDACAPHRNKNNKAAPVLAFPIDGPNSTIGGANTKKSAMDEVFGNDPTLDDDDNNNTNLNMNSISNKNSDLYMLKNGNSTKDAIRSNQLKNVRNVDATSRTKVHGVETSGLGSSTFLDGAPATGVPQNGNSYTGYNSNSSFNKSKSLQRNNTISYGGMKNNFNSNTFNSHNNSNYSDLRRNLSTHSHQGNDNRLPIEYSRAHSAGNSRETSVRNSNDGAFNRSHDDGNFNYNDDDEDDLYINNKTIGNNGGGVRFDSSTKKSSSTGSKFLKRVKSLKVGSRKN